ncbi:MAG TPA: nucleoside-diphosphate kinase [Thiomicrospira sp.]|jgi:nucleoside-diphosphate kinase|nr:nucleoside-diphosphate kinase [Thiomicrospira sp.]
MLQRTFSIIKPDAVARNLIGQILTKLEEKGLSVVASKMIHLSEEQAAGFYAEHKDKPFYPTLLKNMISGPLIVQVLEAENAVELNRSIMGATDPDKAAEGTLRRLFAISMQQNSVHGSDSIESAKREIAYFFDESEIFER